MARRNGNKTRCPGCRVNFRYCFCSEISKLNNSTPIEIIMHFRERYLTSNTALLAENTLELCKIYERGEKGVELDLELICDNDNYTPLFLFPASDAIELSRDYINSLSKPAKLIVPDGSWRQAKKIQKRAGFHKVQAVSIPFTRKSNYKLRTQAQENQLCTYEAIADALGIIEGEELRVKMLEYFDLMVERNLQARSGKTVHKHLINVSYEEFKGL